MQTLDQGQREVTFINLTMGGIGIIGKDGKGLYKMLKNLELSSQEISFLLTKLLVTALGALIICFV